MVATSPAKTGVDAVPATVENCACVQCNAPIKLRPNQTHCRCSFCGTKFVVGYPGNGLRRLVPFTAVLHSVKAPSDRSEERGAELERRLVAAGREVAAQRQALDRAAGAYRLTLSDAQVAVAPAQYATLAVGLAAAVVWFLVVFAFDGITWYVGLITALVLTLLARLAHGQWLSVEATENASVEEARRVRGVVASALDEASARREERALEHELWTRLRAQHQGSAHEE